MNKMSVKVFTTGILVFLISMASVLYAAETPRTPEPVAVMPETFFEFPPVVEGEIILHDFILQNHGDLVLNVLEVKTS